VDRAALIQAGLIRGDWDAVKLLADGEIGLALTVKLDRVSRSAQAKIEAAGGTVEVGT